MSRFFYARLAATNIRKNAKTYIPYILTCIFTVTMFYIMRSLAMNAGIKTLYGASTIAITMEMGSQICGFFAVIFLFYTNSFLMKRRKKEFGLFNILGMEKKHLARVIGIETLYIAAISLVIGILLGISLDKAIYLLLLKLLKLPATLGFYISTASICTTLILFGIIFLLIFLNSLRQIHLANPIELLKAGNVGEREPKSNWIITILGALCLGVGYYISLTTKDVTSAVILFFLAVILVIVGTYLLFTAGSVTLLKLLRKNKSYYYQTKHFISVSGMIYRMKQNAVGLASICILSTMVLVMISSTTSMIVGVDQVINSQCPYDIMMTLFDEKTEGNDKTIDIVRKTISEKGLQVETEVTYPYLNFLATQQDNRVTFATENLPNGTSYSSVFFIPLSAYNKYSGESKTLDKGQVLIYSEKETFKHETFQLYNEIFQVKERLKTMPDKELFVESIVDSHFVILSDTDELYQIYDRYKSDSNRNQLRLRVKYGCDFTGNKSEQAAISDDLLDDLIANEHQFSISFKTERIDTVMSMYGSLFFLGIFLGTLFIMATILIIYYKQISEGYDDKERFEIMQKVGMSHLEVKKAIRSQILTVFYLPLLAAGVHVIFAFPIIAKILAALYLTNVPLFITCTVACFLVFAVLYAIIYSITAKSYYKIVSR